MDYYESVTVATPKAGELVCSVFAAAEKKPFPTEADRVYLPNMKRLVRFLHELATMADGGPFFLSSRNAAEVLGVAQQRASVFLSKLEDLGIIRRLKTGGKSGMANEYLYNREFR